MRLRTKVILLLLGLFAGIAAWSVHSRYLVLSIPVLRHEGGDGFWWESQFSELAYSDSWGVLYLHRQVGTAYTHRHGWRTVDEAFAYFDSWLTKHGWERRDSSDGGNPILPESRLVEASQSRAYCRPGDEWCLSEEVALAIWPVGGSVEGFHVVIVTAKPSFLRSFQNAFDD